MAKHRSLNGALFMIFCNSFRFQGAMPNSWKTVSELTGKPFPHCRKRLLFLQNNLSCVVI